MAAARLSPKSLFDSESIELLYQQFVDSFPTASSDLEIDLAEVRFARPHGILAIANLARYWYEQGKGQTVLINLHPELHAYLERIDLFTVCQAYLVTHRSLPEEKRLSRAMVSANLLELLPIQGASTYIEADCLQAVARAKHILEVWFPAYPMERYRVCNMLSEIAAMRDPNVPDDRRCDLPRALHDDLGNRNYFDIVAFTHLDNDHICGATEFFRLDHDRKYQGDGRIIIKELWVPAAAITELTKNLKPEAQVLQAEARYRLRIGKGIRVFSRPARLETWLTQNGLTLASRAHLITDAGQLVPGYSLAGQGVEFFIHSPFAHRMNGIVIDRNDLSLVFQATFLVGGQYTQLIMSADITSDLLSELIAITRAHKRDDRLAWDIFKLPHHCSYLSLSDDKGKNETTPVPAVKWLFEEQGQRGGIIVSTSDPIPAVDTTQPHTARRQTITAASPASD